MMSDQLYSLQDWETLVWRDNVTLYIFIFPTALALCVLPQGWCLNKPTVLCFLKHRTDIIMCKVM